MPTPHPQFRPRGGCAFVHLVQRCCLRYRGRETHRVVSPRQRSSKEFRCLDTPLARLLFTLAQSLHDSPVTDTRSSGGCMSKDVRKPGSDNWEKSETGGRFVRDVIIVGAILAGG